jgi:hypothetical protein
VSTGTHSLAHRMSEHRYSPSVIYMSEHGTQRLAHPARGRCTYAPMRKTSLYSVCTQFTCLASKKVN